VTCGKITWRHLREKKKNPTLRENRKILEDRKSDTALPRAANTIYLIKNLESKEEE